MGDISLATPFSPGQIHMNGASEPKGLFPGSPDLTKVAHPELGEWQDFRARLRPHYGRAWVEIALCLTMLGGGYAAHFFLTYALGNLAGALAAPVAALWIGFWLNALLTFGHEAAHYNLSSSRARNDLFADWSIWLFFPQSTRSYRKSHWQHHLHLGDPQDTEISYHNCMSPWFLAKAISGIYLVELAARYALGKGIKAKSHDAAGNARPAARRGTLLAVARAAATHATLVGVPLCFRCYATAVAWLAGAALVFPFLATVRQLLEHRAAEAHCATDYRQVPHGAVNRMFTTNLFSRFFGAAGFNRHMMHHWDPTVSYTCFDEMESFFQGTNLRERLDAARTSYASSVVLLTRKALRDLA